MSNQFSTLFVLFLAFQGSVAWATEKIPGQRPSKSLTLKIGDGEMIFVNGEIGTNQIFSESSQNRPIMNSTDKFHIQKDLDCMIIWVKDPRSGNVQFKIVVSLFGISYRVRLYFGSAFKLYKEEESFLTGNLWDGKAKYSDIQLQIIATGTENLIKFFLDSIGSLADPKDDRMIEWFNSRLVSSWISTFKALYQVLIKAQDDQFRFLARCVVIGIAQAWEKNKKALVNSENPQILKVLDEIDQIMSENRREFNSLIGTEYNGMNLSLGLSQFDAWQSLHQSDVASTASGGSTPRSISRSNSEASLGSIHSNDSMKTETGLKL